MLIAPYGFEVIMLHGGKRHLSLHSNKKEWREDYEKNYGEGGFDRLVIGITNLCQIGLLGLNTKSFKGGVVKFSYYWTNLGNDVLHLLSSISQDEVKKRRSELPEFF